MALEGNVAIVTGGSRGIGRATSLALARDGADVVVNYMANSRMAGSVVNEIEAMGRKALALPADVSNYKSVEGMVDGALSTFGRVDILVNNAGVGSTTWIQDITDAEWDRVLNVNLKGAFNCVRAVLPNMLARRSGRIINISSDAARQGGVTAGVHYCAAKAGLIGLTKSLARKLAEYNINVNAVAPGTIWTDIVAKERTEEQRERLLRSAPLRRFGSVEEVAAVVVFLARPEAGYITGATIDVNGGSYMA